MRKAGLRLYSVSGLVMLLMLAASAGAAQAQSGADEINRLREALRSTTAQLRALEDRQVALQARANQGEQQAMMLQTKLQEAQAELQAVSGRLGDSEVRRSHADRQVAAQAAALGRFEEQANRWKSAYDEAANVAQAKEAERVRLAGEANALGERSKACEAKNVELFRVGMEILLRYEKVNLGDIVAYREPFIGFKRVELENLVQDYQDKLSDQKVIQ